MNFGIMNSLLIVIFVSFIHNCCGQCTPLKPFFMNDQSCAGFNEICIKNENPHCKSLLDACQQCPPNNVTVVAMLDLAARIRGNQNITKELLEKNVNNLKDQLLTRITFGENKTDQLLARIASMENKTANIPMLLWVIIFLLFLLIIILLLEVRFKCITKCCEKLTEKGLKRTYRNLKMTMYTKTQSPIEELRDALTEKYQLLENSNKDLVRKVNEISVYLTDKSNPIREVNANNTQTELGQLNEKIAQLEQERETKDKDLIKKETALEALTVKLTDKTRLLEKSDKQLIEKVADLDKYKKTLATEKDKYDKLAIEIKAKDEKIKQLRIEQQNCQNNISQGQDNSSQENPEWWKNHIPPRGN